MGDRWLENALGSGDAHIFGEIWQISGTTNFASLLYARNSQFSLDAVGADFPISPWFAGIGGVAAVGANSSVLLGFSPLFLQTNMGDGYFLSGMA